MRQDHTEGTERRTRRSSGRAYAEIMQGRESRGADRSVYDRYDSRDADDDAYDDWTEEADALQHRHRRKRRKKHRAGKIILLVLLMAAAFFIGKNLLQGENWTVAVFGVDSREGEMEKGTRSDVIMLVNLNKRTGDIRLASVYRDTYLKIGDDTYSKINAAYEKGGHEQAVKALEENLDIRIDDYMTFSWAAVAKGINALGGIDLEISDAEFSYINGFITETVNSTGIGSVQLKHAGMNHLDGIQAVSYGRLRLMDTDFNRTARQRKVLGLAMDKAKAADFDTLKNMALAVLPDVSTSIGIDDLVPLLRDVSRYQIAEATGFPYSLKTEKLSGQDYVIPTTLESNVVMLHQRFFGEEDYSAPASVQKISAKIGADSGYTEPGQEAPAFGTGGGTSHQTKDEGGAANSTEKEAQTQPESSAEAETESSEEESSTEEGAEESAEAETESGQEPDGADGEEETTEEAEAPSGGPLKPSENRPQTEAPQQTKAPQQTEGAQIGDAPLSPNETGHAEPDASEETSAGPGAEKTPLPEEKTPEPDTALQGPGIAEDGSVL